MGNDKQGGDSNKNPTGGTLKQMKRNVGGLSLMPTEMHKRQLDDLDIGLILQWVESSTFGLEVCHASAAARHYWNTWDLLQVTRGVQKRCCMSCDAMGDDIQLLALRAMCAEVLQHVQNFLLWGHLGQKKMREKVIQRFSWIGIWEDCNNWVAKCNECTRVKVPPKRPREPLGEMLVGATLARLVTNILGPFSESTLDKKYVLAVTNYFIKWVEIFTMPD